MNKRRIAVISILIVLLTISTLWMLLLRHLLSLGEPNMGDSLFVPASIEKVSDDQDVVVPIHPIYPYREELKEYSELSLNDIEKGWITEYYNGYCRLIFELSDSNLAYDLNLEGFRQYFYADLIPRQRLILEDQFDMLIASSVDPFASDEKPTYYPDSIQNEIYMYYHLKSLHLTRNWLIRNSVIIVVVLGIDIGIVYIQRKIRIRNSSIQDVRDNLISNHMLTREDYEVLKAAYVCGTASPMIALINVLRDMSKVVNSGETINCLGVKKGITTITSDNVNEVIKKLFDADLLEDVLDSNN